MIIKCNEYTTAFQILKLTPYRQLVSASSMKCIDVDTNSRIVFADCLTTRWGAWKFMGIPAGETLYQNHPFMIYNLYSGQCLGVSDVDPPILLLEDCHSEWVTTSQAWFANPVRIHGA